MQILVARERPPGALEHVMIGGVEAHQSREKAPVCLGQRVPDQVAPAREALLERVQPSEDLLHRFVVGRLSGREAGPVYAVVEVLVDKFVDEVDLSAQRRRIVVARLRAHAVEGAVEYADDLGGLVVDDALRLLVPQGRHGAGAGVIRFRRAVGFVQPGEAVHRVRDSAGKRIAETPAFGAIVGQRRGDRDHRLQALQLAENEGAMRPGAVVGDVEVVAAGLGLETRRAVRGDEVAEPALRTNETPADHVRPLVGPFSVDEHAHPLRLNPPWRRRSSRPSRSAQHRISAASPTPLPKLR